MNPSADGWQEAYVKARDFVSQLTLAEKVNLTTGIGWESGQCVGEVGSVPRLGLRGLCMQDSPLGIRFGDFASAFTSGQTVAASFDRSLMYRRGEAMGAEHKGKGVNVVLGPVAGPLGRTPEGGRNWEGFSPDPYLTGVAIGETIKGIQDAGVVACAKHFILNEQEHFRQVGEANGYGYDIDETLSSNIDDKTLHETYLWPFADAVRAGVGAVMCSYQQVNNSYACQNSKTMNGLLKGELGFQGFVMSDWQAQHAGVPSAVAGMDMAMPGDTEFNTGRSFWGTNLTVAVLNGTLPAYRIDDMAMRIMAAFFKVGQTVDNIPPVTLDSWTSDTFGWLHASVKDSWQQVNWHKDVQADHGSLIREIAGKSTVLLKNNGVLPLKKPKFLAVIGEDAGPNYQGPNGCGDRGCDQGTLAMGWGSGTANFPYLSTPLDALNQQAINDHTRLEAVLTNYDTTTIENLVKQDSAIALVFVNADSGEGYINVDGNEGDRKNLTLWKNGDELIKTVAANNNNTVVVIHSVGPTLVTDWYDNSNVTAILWAGLPGQESGNAIVDVLYGRVNPAARTPFTWAAQRTDYGADVLYEPNNGKGAPQQDFTEGNFIDYRALDKAGIKPIFEFGFGLSYSTFKYSNLKIQKNNAGAYKATKGKTAKAPTFGTISKKIEDYVFPSSIRYIREYIYPFLNTTSLKDSSADPDYGKTAAQFLPPNAVDASAQKLQPAAPGLTDTPGGNAQLWDELYIVTADITNTGSVVGDEVPQLYVSLGGADDPKIVLRGFDRIRIDPGQTATFRAPITRRDLSNWDVASQNWVVSKSPKTVYVGPSSRNLPLSAKL
ncbi:glycoside hydrolase family 3 protein [Nemania sp. FL0916]|nr:glycoside hydrolase family 3 protein [Nemania sp. FL0916]